MTPELEKRLNDLVAKTGLAPERVLEEALSDYDAGRMAALDLVAVLRCRARARQGQRRLGASRHAVRVATIFENLEAGANVDDLLEWFDGLDREQVKAVIDFAGRSLEAQVPRR